MTPRRILTTKELIEEHGTVTNLICSCCGLPNLWNIGEFFLCSWCDLPTDERWRR